MIVTDSNDLLAEILLWMPTKSMIRLKLVCKRWFTLIKRRSSILWRSRWRRCQIEVYDSDKGSWKLYGEPFLAPQELQFDHGVYWKGGIHWLGIFFDLQDRVVRNHPGTVVLEDLGTENFDDYYIESNGYLHNIAHFPEKKLVMIFKLQSDYSKWSLKYHINLDGAYWPLFVLNIVRGDNEEDDMLVLHEQGIIMAYKMQGNSVKELINFRMEAIYQENCSSHCL